MRHDRFGRRALMATGAGVALAATWRVARADTATVQVGYLRWTEPQPTISLLDKTPPDDGLAGAKLAISDNDTTGRFMNQRFELSDAPVRADDDPAAVLAAHDGSRHPADPDRRSGGPAAEACRGRAGERGRAVQHPRARRCAAAAGLSRQRDPCRAVAQHAGRCAGAVSGLEEMVALGIGLRLASRGRLAGGCLSPRGEALRRPHREGARIHRHRRCAADRFRRGADPAADAGLHAGLARLRRAGGSG